VVSYTPRPLYVKEKSPRYPLDRRLGRTQDLSGSGGVEKNPFSASAGDGTPIVQPAAESLY